MLMRVERRKEEREKISIYGNKTEHHPSGLYLEVNCSQKVRRGIKQRTAALRVFSPVHPPVTEEDTPKGERKKML